MKTGLVMIGLLLSLAVGLGLLRGDPWGLLMVLLGEYQLLILYFCAGFGLERGWFNGEPLVDPVDGTYAIGIDTNSGFMPIPESEYYDQ